MNGSTTLVLIWDEVIDKIIEKILLGTQSEVAKIAPIFLRKFVLIPLKLLLQEAIFEVQQYAVDIQMFYFWQPVLDQIFQIFYLFILIALGGQFFFLLLHVLVQYIGFSLTKKKIGELFTELGKRLFLLQIVHYILLPFIKLIIELYPDFISRLDTVLRWQYHLIPLFNFKQIQLLEHLLILDLCFLFSIFLLYCLVILQMMGYVFYIFQNIVVTYYKIMIGETIRQIFVPMYQSIVTVFILFFFQRVFLLHILHYNLQDTNSIHYFIIIIFLFVCYRLPKIIKKMWS